MTQTINVDDNLMLTQIEEELLCFLRNHQATNWDSLDATLAAFSNQWMHTAQDTSNALYLLSRIGFVAVEVENN
jgi:hypothetical protein